jgi:quinoprotein glucose dehydrogenase
MVGGVEWGGGAVDPTTGTYIVNASQVMQIYTLVARPEADKILQGKLNGPNNLVAGKG